MKKSTQELWWAAGLVATAGCIGWAIYAKSKEAALATATPSSGLAPQLPGTRTTAALDNYTITIVAPVAIPAQSVAAYQTMVRALPALSTANVSTVTPLSDSKTVVIALTAPPGAAGLAQATLNAGAAPGVTMTIVDTGIARQ